jgi:DNA-binding NarL/FixJ family response regulator
VLVDNHDLIRQGLRSFLEAEPEFVIVGEGTSERETVELAERFQPDVLVVDLAIGLNAAGLVTRRSPQTRVLILSRYNDEAYALEALRKGATGYALKESSADELIQAVREVAAGQRYLARTLSERAIDFYVRERDEDASLGANGGLTSREREVLQLAAEGLKNTEISERLSISPRTAETHRTNIMRKLGLRNQADLVRYALRRGIIQLDT